MIKAANNDKFSDRDRIIKLVLLQKDKLYSHGMHGDDNTFDCAGLVWFVYHEILGIDIYLKGVGRSTTTRIMTSFYGKLIFFEEDVLDKDISIINRGDIVFFYRQSMTDFKPKEDNKYPGHCGIYLGNNSFIHATLSTGNVVVTTPEDQNYEYWLKKLVASKDIISSFKPNKLVRKRKY